MKHKSRAAILAFIMAGTLCLQSERVQAVAYCALRDPVDAIQNFYPQYSGYRSIVGTIGPEVRSVLEEKIPYHTHFSEFGQHTLYVVFSQREMVGLVHARTEKGDWGLDEIVWSLEKDLSVRDFRYQRSRSRYKNEVSSPEFKALLSGRKFEELIPLLSPDGSSLVENYDFISKEAEPLAVTVILSALKTILVTELAWGVELGQIAAQNTSGTPGQR